MLAHSLSLSLSLSLSHTHTHIHTHYLSFSLSLSKSALFSSLVVVFNRVSLDAAKMSNSIPRFTCYPVGSITKRKLVHSFLLWRSRNWVSPDQTEMHVHPYQFSSVQSLSRVWLFATCELQHARPPCPSPTPRVHLNSHPLSQWCHRALSSFALNLSTSRNFLLNSYSIKHIYKSVLMDSHTVLCSLTDIFLVSFNTPISVVEVTLFSLRYI